VTGTECARGPSVLREAAHATVANIGGCDDEDDEVVTPTTGLRARKKAQLREAIEREGLRLFAIHGFDGTTVDAIAEACNVSATTVFRYFPTKEDIVFASAARDGDKLVELLAQQPEDLKPAAALYRALSALCNEYAGNKANVAKNLRTVENSISLRARTAEWQQRWERSVLEELRGRTDATHQLVDDLTLRLITATGLSSFRIALEVWATQRRGALEDIVEIACEHLAKGFDT
jgi:AcrR family transcriptional regulator